MESNSWLVNQCLALSPSESGNNLNFKRFFCYSFVFDRVAYFNEVFHMRVQILTWQPLELDVLKHLQGYSFQLEVIRLYGWSSYSILNNRKR